MLKGKRIKTIIALLLCFIMTFGSPLVIMADNTQQATESQETDGDSGESSGQQDSGSSQETSDGQKDSGSGQETAAGQSSAEQATGGQQDSGSGQETAAEQSSAEQTTGGQQSSGSGQETAAGQSSAEQTTGGQQGSGSGQETAAEQTTAGQQDSGSSQYSGSQQEAPAKQETAKTQTELVQQTADPGQSEEAAQAASGQEASSGSTAAGSGSAASSHMGGSLNTDNKLIEEKYTDAEKYSLDVKDYDNQLCWAATAANMLWDAGYASEAVNPLTNNTFGSEDELFDYFRQCFTDEASSPEGAIDYFANNHYDYVGEEGYSQLRQDAPVGGLLEDGINKNDIVLVEHGKQDVLEALGDLKGKQAGALIKWWNSAKAALEDRAHWLNVVSLAINEATSQYEGIWLSDSDNDSATDAGLTSSDPEERARLAAGMPNSQTYYPLSYKNIDGTYYWVVEDFDEEKNDNISAIISWICYLNDMQKNEEKHSEESSGHSDHSSSSGSDNSGQSVNSGSSGVTEALNNAYKTLKTAMEQNGLEVYSPFAGRYAHSANSAYNLIVRRPGVYLQNIYVDGQRVSADGANYRIDLNPEGLFTFTLSREFMQSLSKGTHTLKMEFYNAGDVATNITVE